MSANPAACGTPFSVVINTYNRGASLRNTLACLRYQTHERFEVIVVNGPSTDDTAAVLAEFPDVCVAHCPEAHLSKSRNIGIVEACGDIVAFIDDDALPEPHWLAELARAYDSPHVGGAGGIVYNHTGFKLQYDYAVCDRLGNTTFDVRPPLDAYLRPGADPFLYLQGTNCSFRRDCLLAVGGFDEEIEFYLDEVDVCLRVLDRGYELRPLPGAAVHHKFLASHLRTGRRVLLDPFAIVKNRCYLAVLYNHRRLPIDELRRRLQPFLDEQRDNARAWHAAGQLTDAQYAHFLARVERGFAIGVEKGLGNARRHREFPEADPQRFRPFRVLCPAKERLKVCFVSQEYPPHDFGGIGRFTCDLAAGMAARGHEIHVVTRSPDCNRVDFEDGVWMHRLAAQGRHVPELERLPLAGPLFHAAGVYHEVCRIHAAGPIDVVSAPLWASEGLVCLLDERFPTVLTLMTSLKTVAALHASWHGAAWLEQGLALERAAARRARYLHPISAAILEQIRADYGSQGKAAVVPLGAADRAGQVASSRAADDGRVQILFVGRLERRKGVDVLLEAAVELCARFPRVEFLLAGKDTPNTETGRTYREGFEEDCAGQPALRDRVRFLGAVKEEQLQQLYADADIVCMPSRYESFGLVLVEAMAFGKPVVACAAGGMCEIVEPEGNGLLSAPGDARSLASCLARLLADEKLRRRFGTRSRQLYEERFALGHVVERTVQWYRQIAREDTARRAPSNDSKVTQPLGEVIAEAGKMPPRRAWAAAARLLDPSCHPVDYLAAVRQVWTQPSEQFVTALYQLLFQRDPDAEGLAHRLRALEAGVPRRHVVRELALSEEARLGRIPTAWSRQLAHPIWDRPVLRKPMNLLRKIRAFLRRAVRGGSTSSAAPAEVIDTSPRAAGAPMLSRLWRHVRSMEPARRACRLGKRLALLPWRWTVRELEGKLGHLEQTVVQARAQQREAINKLKYCFADLYGALVAQEQENNERLQRLEVAQQELARAVSAALAALAEANSTPHGGRPMLRVTEQEPDVA